MSGREPRTVRVKPEVWSSFVEQVVEWEGQKSGELGRHVENALEEYIDHGRQARIEEKVDRILSQMDGAHTHKHSEATAKARHIAEEIAAEDAVVIPEDVVVRAIEAIAGADPRTVDKYQEQLKRRGLAYEHPTDAVWTVERDNWFTWASDYVDNNPTATIHDVTEPYPITAEEFRPEMTEIEA